MSDYNADQRLFAALRQAGWLHDPETQGFRKRDLWVSWGQAMDALRLAEDGEAAAGAVGQSETLARIITSAENEI